MSHSGFDRRWLFENSVHGEGLTVEGDQRRLEWAAGARNAETLANQQRRPCQSSWVRNRLWVLRAGNDVPMSAAREHLEVDPLLRLQENPRSTHPPPASITDVGRSRSQPGVNTVIAHPATTARMGVDITMKNLGRFFHGVALVFSRNRDDIPAQLLSRKKGRSLMSLTGGNKDSNAALHAS